MTDTAENVVWLDGAEAKTLGVPVPVPVSAVCDAAKDACEEIVVIGYQKGDGKLYCAASFANASAEKTVWIMEQAKAWLLKGCPADE